MSPGGMQRRDRAEYSPRQECLATRVQCCCQAVRPAGGPVPARLPTPVVVFKIVKCRQHGMQQEEERHSRRRQA